MAANEENGVGIDQQVYLAADIQRMLVEEVYKQKNPPFKVLKIGKLFRVPKKGFDDWLNGGL